MEGKSRVLSYLNTDVVPEHLPRGKWTETGARVLAERYLMKDDDGNLIEDGNLRYWRVAYGAATAEIKWSSETAVIQTADAFYTMMAKNEFLPNSPTVANLGKNHHALSGCYVVPLEDSIPGIGDAVKWQMMIHASGGGTGFALSRLRPRGSRVRSTQGIASGPVSFLKILDAATNEVKQGGMRRGANMAVLRVDHPDIIEFIKCKLPTEENPKGAIENFNISVGVTDEFMAALHGKGPDGGEVGRFFYYLRDPQTGKPTVRVDARRIMAEIVDAAWRSGDPGVVFLDRINQGSANPVPALPQFTIETTNPCGEQPLAPFDACNLGSINLEMFVLPLARYTLGTPVDALMNGVDWDRLVVVTRLAVRFLSDIVEINPFPLPQIRETVDQLRRIGLGVMGWSGMLYKLGVPYDSEEAVELGRRVMANINDVAHDESRELAKVRGCFPLQPQSRYAGDAPIYNGAATTIAPTGTISLIAGASSGIEPTFALAMRHIVGDRTLIVADETFKADVEGLLHRGFSPDFCERLLDFCSRKGRFPERGERWSSEPGGHFTDQPELVRMAAVYKTAPQIAWPWHVKMQAAFQAHTDNGVSKTINLPESATREDVEQAYQMAWDTGCMGITVFRTGSKGGAKVLHAGLEDDTPTKISTPPIPGFKREWTPEDITQLQELMDALEAVPPHERYRIQVVPGNSNKVEVIPPATMTARPPMVHAHSYRKETPLGSAYINVTHNEAGEPFEVFIDVGLAGSDIKADAEAIGKALSMLFRVPSPISVWERAGRMAKQYRGIGGRASRGLGAAKVTSLADAVAQVLEEEIERNKQRQKSTPEPELVELGKPFDNPVGYTFNPVMNRLEEHSKQPEPEERIGDLCPECQNATLAFEEGCQKCYSCGYSEC